MTSFISTGSCAAAGYSSAGCCTGGYCAGSPPNCFCEPDCVSFRDCCDDFNSVCCKCTNRLLLSLDLYRAGPFLVFSACKIKCLLGQGLSNIVYSFYLSLVVCFVVNPVTSLPTSQPTTPSPSLPPTSHFTSQPTGPPQTIPSLPPTSHSTSQPTSTPQTSPSQPTSRPETTHSVPPTTTQQPTTTMQPGMSTIMSL